MSTDNYDIKEDEYEDEDKDKDKIELLGENDFIYSIEKGENEEPKVMSGGFEVGSYFLQEGLSPIVTLNNQDGGSDKVSSPFEYLVVPAGIFYVKPQNNKKDNDIHYNKHETISDDLYDKLFALIQEEPKKPKNKKTRKHRVEESKSKKKTRRHL
jgi:hypothetical protein